MIKKDYKLIASVFRRERLQASNSAFWAVAEAGMMDMWDNLVDGLIEALHADNDRFMPDRFRVACHREE